MNKLYNIPKLKNDQILNLINEFFINTFENDEYCQTESQNLINLYYEYFMRKHCVDSTTVQMVIHPTRPKDFSSDEYAYIEFGSKHDYDVYLSKHLMKSYKNDLQFYNQIIRLLLDAGHEFYHIVQNESEAFALIDIDLKIEEANDVYNDYVTSSNKKRLKHFLNRHIQNLNLLHETEIAADYFSNVTLIKLLDDLIKLNDSEIIIKTLQVLKSLTQDEYSSRKKYYHESRQSEKHVAKYLTKLGTSLSI